MGTPTSLEDVRSTYTRWAPIYNATHAWTLPRRHEAHLALGLRPGDRVLDLACGTGLNFPDLRKMVGDAGQVVGVDLSPAMLDVARRLVAARGWKNVELREVDAASLPIPDGFFDSVFCAYALNIIPDYERAIQEMKRVLMPGGRFVSLEMESKIHSVPGWLQPVPHVCAMDMTHRTLDAIRNTFADVQVKDYWMGMIHIAVARKD